MFEVMGDEANIWHQQNSIGLTLSPSHSHWCKKIPQETWISKAQAGSTSLRIYLILYFILKRCCHFSSKFYFIIFWYYLILTHVSLFVWGFQASWMLSSTSSSIMKTVPTSPSYPKHLLWIFKASCVHDCLKSVERKTVTCIYYSQL